MGIVAIWVQRVYWELFVSFSFNFWILILFDLFFLFFLSLLLLLTFTIFISNKAHLRNTVCFAVSFLNPASCAALKVMMWLMLSSDDEVSVLKLHHVYLYTVYPWLTCMAMSHGHEQDRLIISVLAVRRERGCSECNSFEWGRKVMVGSWPCPVSHITVLSVLVFFLTVYIQIVNM